MPDKLLKPTFLPPPEIQQNSSRHVLNLIKRGQLWRDVNWLQYKSWTFLRKCQW